MNNHSFEYISNLQYCLKAVRDQLKAFQSGEKYVRMTEEHRKLIRDYERKIRELNKELAQARKETVTVRNMWFEVFEDLEKEKDKELAYWKREWKKMEERAIRAESQRDAAQDKITEQRQKIYMLETDLEEEKGKNLKLTAQLNHDYENSSLPSSMKVERKKIPNSREKTGRKPGGQPGHTGHSRKKQTATEVIELAPPQEVMDDLDFKKTKKAVVRQVVGIKLLVSVTEYRADIYRNSKTGERVHADFPAGVTHDVNYDGSIKAFLYLLNTECCVSIDKCSRFLSDLTNGKLKISKGMINGLGKEFSEKTKKEQNELFMRILASPVMHTDCTNARINGEPAYVFVCCTPNGEVMYFSRRKKGHEGVKGTVTEDYQGILVHDNESTFYKYGSNHQECLAHVLRYLKDSMENEPERTWNKGMHSLLREMIHYRNGLETGTECDASIVSGYEKRYKELIEKAKEEYEYIPASDYYRDGYNLYLRMDKLMKNHLLFLHDRRVPTNNNEAERQLRNYKRKQKQAVSFRSNQSHDYLCKGMSMLVMMRQNESNLFERVSRILD